MKHLKGVVATAIAFSWPDLEDALGNREQVDRHLAKHVLGSSKHAVDKNEIGTMTDEGPVQGLALHVTAFVFEDGVVALGAPKVHSNTINI